MKKKICILKWVIDASGGGEKVAISLANELAKKDEYEVHLIGITSEIEAPFFEVSDKVIYTNFICQKPRPKIYRYFLTAVRKLRKYIKAHDIDLVLAVGITTNIIALAGTLGTKAKLVVSEHTSIQLDNDYKPSAARRFLGAKFADCVVALTQEERRQYIQKYHLPDDKVICIPNWMDSLASEATYDLSSKRLITVGRFAPEKGYDLLVQVAKQVLPKYPDWQWDIYGAGSSAIKSALQNELAEAGVEHQVNLKGVVLGTENIYPGHSIYVLPSRFEGFGLVLLEAKQFGLPVVSFNCPTGPADIVIDSVNGYLVAPYDIDDMSDKISLLIEQESKRRDFSDRAMLDTEKFQKDTIMNQWNHLIHRLCP